MVRALTGRWRGLLAMFSVILLINGIPLALPEPVSPASYLGAGPGIQDPDGGPRATGVVTPLATPVESALYAVDWNPSDDTALIAGTNGTVLEYNFTTGFRSLPQDESFDIRYVAFRPDNTSTLAILAGFISGGTSSVVLLYDGSSFTRLPTSEYDQIRGVAWSPDASYALIAAKKVQTGVLLKYQGGTLTEVWSDPSRYPKAICWGEAGAFVASYNFDFSSLNISLFDGTSMGKDLQGPLLEMDALGLSWSPSLKTGLCTAEFGTLLKFDRAVATNVQDPALFGLFQGVAWARSRGLALITGADNSNLNDTRGTLFSYNGSTATLESANRYWPLTAAAWHRSDSYALVTGENGTVLRYSAPNSRPWCAITRPAGGEVVAGEIRVTGTAWDPDGDKITAVQVKVDSGQWEEATGGENWSWDWDTTRFSRGTHYLSAKSSDGKDESISDTRMVYVDNPDRPPSVAIDQPSEGAAVAGTVTFTGTASDPDPGDRVELVQLSFDGGSWVSAAGTTDWSHSWDTLSVPDGPHKVRARAYDGELNSSEALRNLTVQNHGPNAPPTCAITFPAPGATVTGRVQIGGTAADADNDLQAVFVRIDAGGWQQAAGSSDWSYLWDTGPAAGGGHTVSARAYDGTVYSSEASLTLFVNHPPACSISSPAEGAVVSGTVTVQGNASDPDPGSAISAVFVKVDAGNWTRAVGTSSWTYRWETAALSPGQHTLRAKSSDGDLESPESSLSVTVERPLHAVVLSDPTEVGEDYVVLEWTPNSDPGFLQYEVYKSERPGEDLSGLVPKVLPGQSVTAYNYTGLIPRTTYWFRVKVVDSARRGAVSNEVFATTERENQPPFPSLAASKTKAYTGETITFSAGGSYDPDRSGRIVRFQWDFEGKGRFPVDSGLIDTQKHEFDRPGRYMVQLKVTDNRGASSIASVNVTIEERPKAGVELALLLGGAILVLAVAGVAIYLFLRGAPPEESYYEVKVHRPAVKRRKEYWPAEEEEGRAGKVVKRRKA